ncbi:helix-turn-helix domain-containing protein [Mycolicibacterium smegmatis]|uniref:PucR family transcriptional regulator n=1 Tax=Mycolicibacterium smegmatis TaxID=1772 RepID=UPI001E4221AD|nr:helix-turn-helix domain-containing protein [Mycolicibacterium smegmatis]UGU33127.1 helix-turn-helix domain-containing protein [Mycolicibacterium smegmatis]ULN68005.1 helix-turn-helix domain-containing protein [Mycolicibacterium smegmatis]
MERVREQLLALTAALREERSAVTASFTRRLREIAPEYYAIDASDFQDAGWMSLPVVVEGALRALDTGATDDRLPRELIDESITAYHSGLPWEVLDRSYRLTHQVLWEHILRVLADLRLRGAEQALLLRTASNVLFRYFDNLCSAAGHVYIQAERAGRRDERMVHLIGQIIDGVAVPDTALGYRLGQTHVAVIAWGADPRPQIDAAVRDLRIDSLVVPTGEREIWAWFGLTAERSFDELRSAIGNTPGNQVALGSVAQGRKGFVTTHRQAKLAASLWARKLVAPCGSTVTYGEISLLSVALENENTARVFVEHQLGALLADEGRGRELRETLIAYTKSGLNARTTGKMLGVAERTIRYRLGRLEGLLGSDFRQRLPELAAASVVADALEAQQQARSQALR